jgi:hypothetical protein
MAFAACHCFLGKGSGGVDRQQALKGAVCGPHPWYAEISRVLKEDFLDSRKTLGETIVRQGMTSVFEPALSEAEGCSISVEQIPRASAPAQCVDLQSADNC